MKTKTVRIIDKTFVVNGDDDYLQEIDQEFEPDNVACFKVLCDEDSRILDAGANIGVTAIALSRICPRGQIAAIEPLPHNFAYLQRNVSEAGATNLKIFNFALGNSNGLVLMQGHPSNFRCSFVADNYRIPAKDHFSQEVPLRRLDEAFSEIALDRLDFMKVDVEGFELEVLQGAKEILNTYKPIVFLEMNHWCLNIYRRMSIPEFREELMKIFPCIYAVDGLDYLDYVDEKNVHHINYHHVLQFRFMNLVAGFDRYEILSRLSRLPQM